MEQGEDSDNYRDLNRQLVDRHGNRLDHGATVWDTKQRAFTVTRWAASKDGKSGTVYVVAFNCRISERRPFSDFGITCVERNDCAKKKGSPD